MTEVLGVPLHAALVHFPIAAAVFGLAAVGVAFLLAPPRRRPFLLGGALLLCAGTLFGLGAAVTGRAWAEAGGFLPGGGWVPDARLRAGLPRWHALLGLAGCVASALAAAAAFRAAGSRERPAAALFLALLSAATLLVAGHLGGILVHVPEPPGAPPVAPVSRAGGPADGRLVLRDGEGRLRAPAGRRPAPASPASIPPFARPGRAGRGDAC